jgi:hypothetical protein
MLRSSSQPQKNRAADQMHLNPEHGPVSAFDAAVVLLSLFGRFHRTTRSPPSPHT